MKAPDKIYLRQIPNQKVEMFWYHKRGKFCENHEYILKDLLLEWAVEELEKRRNTGDDYFHPAIVVLNDVIDKIEQL